MSYLRDFTHMDKYSGWGTVSTPPTGSCTSHTNIPFPAGGVCVWGGIPSPTQAGGVILPRADLELGADARRLLLLVEVEQRLGDAVGQRQVAEVLQRLHAD